MRKKNIFVCVSIVTILIIISHPTVMSNGRENDIDNKSMYMGKDSTEIRSIDNNKEIFTRINAIVWFEDAYYGGDGLLWRLELIDTGWDDAFIHIHGFKKPLLPIRKNYFNFNVGRVSAPVFIGWIIPYEEFFVKVHGTAFGNIEWS